MGNLKSILQRWPSLYRFLQRLYYGLRRVTETHILGTKLQEWIWKTRHIYKGDSWVSGYCESISHPHRRFLVGRISSYAPLASILEIGCNTGPNLYLLAKEFPEAEIYGIDINHRAVKKGEDWLRQNGIRNVMLYVGKADELKQFADKSVDLVFTDATLMYVGSDKINKVLKEMIRVARKALIFNEYHFTANFADPKPRNVFYYDGHWVYDYKMLLMSYVSSNKITITKLPKDLWGGSGWEEFGSVIEVKL